MNDRQAAKLSMYKAVNAYCTENAAITATVPAFHTAIADFSARINAIRLAAQAEAFIITGITAGKASKKLTLCNTALTVASALFAYAASTGNMELKHKAGYSFTSLSRMSAIQLPVNCRNIHAAATENAAALSPFGITQATLDSFIAAIQSFEAAAPEPRNAVSRRSAQVMNLATLFRQADNILKLRMDKLALLFKSTHPAFYLNYKNNRIIIDPATRSANNAVQNTVQKDTAPLHH